MDINRVCCQQHDIVGDDAVDEALDRHDIVAQYMARLPDAHDGASAHECGVLASRYIFVEEIHQFLYLSSSFSLGSGEILGIGRIYVVNA